MDMLADLTIDDCEDDEVLENCELDFLAVSGDMFSPSPCRRCTRRGVSQRSRSFRRKGASPQSSSPCSPTLRQSPDVHLGEFVNFLRRTRGCILRSWRLDLDMRGCGRVDRKDLRCFCQRNGFSSERTLWDKLRPDGSPRPLEFHEIAPKEANCVRAFLDIFEGEHLRFDLHRSWSSLSPEGRSYIGFDDFYKGARRLGFDGNAHMLFSGLDTTNLRRVWKEDLAYLHKVGRRKQTTPRNVSPTNSPPPPPKAVARASRTPEPRKLKSPFPVDVNSRPEWNDSCWRPCDHNTITTAGSRIYFNPPARPTLQQQQEKIASRLTNGTSRGAGQRKRDDSSRSEPARQRPAGRHDTDDIPDPERGDDKSSSPSSGRGGTAETRRLPMLDLQKVRNDECGGAVEETAAADSEKKQSDSAETPRSKTGESEGSTDSAF
eukprot:TRINITY_DN68523_c0_g1_i1.p1 TRINITY_DN68523_c0_g1~~TRINITY_DN68523_c0_g1_i1.p1  ORF type:complete len:433 (+),score=68.21 TRINITY_DN68523_c0_g1_i1:223-1521(+)